MREMRPISAPWRLALGLFATSALLGAWTAYDRLAALAKLGNLFGGILLYYAAFQMAARQRHLFVEALEWGAGLLSLGFLLSRDVTLGGADFEWIDQIGAVLAQVPPEEVPRFAMGHDRVAGILAMLLPLQAATVFLAFRRKERARVAAAALAVLVSLLGLVMTSSRGAWAALVVSAAALTGLRLSQSILPRHKSHGWSLLRLVIASVAIILLGIALLQLPWSAWLAQIGMVPGKTSFADRLQLYRQTLELVKDVPFTGSGLASFAGLYSQYILVIPVFFLGYSHNLYLDVLLEQGPIGLTAFLGVWLGSLLILIRRVTAASDPSPAPRILAWGILGGLIISLVNGVMGDPLYAGRGTPLPFLLPGLAVGIVATDAPHSAYDPLGIRGAQWIRARWREAAILLGALVMGAGVMAVSRLGPRIASAWYANLGVLSMAKGELVAWPVEGWQDERDLARLGRAEALFRRALAYWPGQPTALYHLGRIELDHQEFGSALRHLQQAWAARPTHEGVRKNLGYALAWAGEETRSLEILRGFPEAQEELRHYGRWWKQQGRDDLATAAARLRTGLEARR